MADLRARAGLAAIVAFAAAFAVGVAGAGAADTPTPLKITKKAYYTNKVSGALPPVLVKEVPPGPVCLVAPQICTEQLDSLKTALSLNDGVPLPDIPDYLVPQPIPPGESPVGMIGGATRYSSAIQFQVPDLAPNSVVNRFDLVIKDGSVAFSLQSPAFRQLILTILSQYPEQQPEVVDKFIADVTAQNTALSDFTPTGIEACMITTAWEAGESQDPAAKPKTDCIAGAIGKHDEAAGTWTFDVSGIAQAWANGAANQGIALGPLGAANVAYGDPDPSTNFIITLNAGEGDTAPGAIFDIGPPEPELSLDPAPEASVEEPLAPAGDLGDVTGALGDTGAPAQSGSGAAVGGRNKARLASAGGETPWWIWLIVPFVLAGCVALSVAFDAVPDLATRRPGALTRLTARSE